MINNQEKVNKARESIGFLIYKNIVGLYHYKTLKKIKREGKKETKDIRKMLLKIKEDRDLIKILGLYLPLESMNKDNKYCRKYVIPLIKK